MDWILEEIKKTAQRFGCTVEDLIRYYEERDPEYGKKLMNLTASEPAAQTCQDPDR